MPLNKELFPSLLKSLWQSNCFSADNIKAGFKTCGIMPWDVTQMPSSMYDFAELFDWPAPPLASDYLGPTSSQTPTADVLFTLSASSADVPSSLESVPSSSTDDSPLLYQMSTMSPTKKIIKDFSWESWHLCWLGLNEKMMPTNKGPSKGNMERVWPHTNVCSNFKKIKKMQQQ